MCFERDIAARRDDLVAVSSQPRTSDANLVRIRAPRLRKSPPRLGRSSRCQCRELSRARDDRSLYRCRAARGLCAWKFADRNAALDARVGDARPYAIQLDRAVGSPPEHTFHALLLNVLLSVAALCVLAATALVCIALDARTELTDFLSTVPFVLMREFARRFAFAHGHTLVVLAAASMIAAIGAPAAVALTTTECARSVAIIAAVTAVLTCALVWVMMSKWGVLGAAYALLIAETVGNVARWTAFLILPARSVAENSSSRM